MKAAVLTGLGRMEVRQVPDPKIEKDTDVLLKIEKVGVCGSDVHYFETGRIGSQVVQYPFIVGHECAATVTAVGKGVKHVKVGEQVVVEPAVPCHNCDQCHKGRENTCFNLRFLGTPGQGGGCLCEYLVMPEECCLPTQGKLTLEQGALCEPLTIGSLRRQTVPAAPCGRYRHSWGRTHRSKLHAFRQGTGRAELLHDREDPGACAGGPARAGRRGSAIR